MIVHMGACRIFFMGGQIKGSGDESYPAGFRGGFRGQNPGEGEGLGVKPPEADMY